MFEIIFIVSHGLHTGVVINREHALKYMPFLSRYFNGYPLIEIGWGDEDYYRENKVTLMMTARSIFYPTNSVLHVVGIPDHPDKYFEGCDVEELHINEQCFAAMANFINASFKLTIQNKPENLGSRICDDENYFFRANGKYHAFNTCNVWTAKALKESGFPINPFLKLTSGSVMKLIKKNKHFSH